MLTLPPRRYAHCAVAPPLVGLFERALTHRRRADNSHSHSASNASSGCGGGGASSSCAASRDARLLAASLGLSIGAGGVRGLLMDDAALSGRNALDERGFVALMRALASPSSDGQIVVGGKEGKEGGNGREGGGRGGGARRGSWDLAGSVFGSSLGSSTKESQKERGERGPLASSSQNQNQRGSLNTSSQKERERGAEPSRGSLASSHKHSSGGGGGASSTASSSSCQAALARVSRARLSRSTPADSRESRGDASSSAKRGPRGPPGPPPRGGGGGCGCGCVSTVAEGRLPLPTLPSAMSSDGALLGGVPTAPEGGLLAQASSMSPQSSAAASPRSDGTQGTSTSLREASVASVASHSSRRGSLLGRSQRGSTKTSSQKSLVKTSSPAKSTSPSAVGNRSSAPQMQHPSASSRGSLKEASIPSRRGSLFGGSRRGSATTLVEQEAPFVAPMIAWLSRRTSSSCSCSLARSVRAGGRTVGTPVASAAQLIGPPPRPLSLMARPRSSHYICAVAPPPFLHSGQGRRR